MLDPLTAVSLASSIFQIIDFTHGVVRDAAEIYQNTEGALTSHQELQRRMIHMRSLSGRLQNSTSGQSTPTDDEIELKELAGQCRSAGQELLDLLEQLTIKDHGVARLMQSVKVSLNASRKLQKMQDIQGRLQRIQTQLNMCLLCIIRNDQSGTASSLQNLVQTSQDEHKIDVQMMIDLRDDLVVQLQNNAALSTIIHKLDVLAQTGDRARLTNSILSSLRYPEMEKRYLLISEAYTETFRWIFHQHENPYRTWLESSTGIFWIFGKPGSGKSTLMKFLVDHPSTRACLENWGGSDVVVASFFFWSPGTDKEKSIEGLMQSILYQILRQDTSLIPQVTSQRWHTGAFSLGHAQPWTRSEVRVALDRALKSDDLKSRFCFFIDGLDEHVGEDFEIVQEINQLASSTRVKLCISSRPHHVFQTAYGADSRRCFRLEELTRDDIDKYVRGMLEEDQLFLRLAREDETAWELVGEIRQQARGVFLWVKLVIRSLKIGLTKDDRIGTLRRRLQSFPQELEDVIDKIFRSIESVYQQLAAQAVLLLHRYTLPGIAPVYIEMEYETSDTGLALRLPPVGLDPSEVEDERLIALAKRAAQLINVWCRGLLEPVPLHGQPLSLFHERNPDGYIYIHRSVSEYFDRRIDVIHAMVGSNFDPTRTLFNIHLWQVKQTSTVQSFNVAWVHMIKEIGAIESDLTLSSLPWIRELDTVGQEISPTKSGGHWSNVIVGNRRIGRLSDALAIRFGSLETARSIAPLPPSALNSLKTLCQTNPGSDDDRFLFALECILCTVYKSRWVDLPAIAALVPLVKDLNYKLPRGNGISLSIWQRFLVEIVSCNGKYWPRLKDRSHQRKVQITTRGRGSLPRPLVIVMVMSYLLRQGADPFATLPQQFIDVQMVGTGETVCCSSTSESFEDEHPVSADYQSKSSTSSHDISILEYCKIAANHAVMTRGEKYRRPFQGIVISLEEAVQGNFPDPEMILSRILTREELDLLLPSDPVKSSEPSRNGKSE